ncbi:hypothetical protein K0M31_016146 [Melipona bicolor]|uniref:Uncharacterized protein n=1 Tax=Melipona bicolor TaxID=60889 RepID=A0AA40G7T0_9HYME|nr:hypothetical protein K0M31_016146 [Melipona bicolor]
MSRLFETCNNFAAEIAIVNSIINSTFPTAGVRERCHATIPTVWVQARMGKIYWFLSTLSRPASPETFGHKTGLCSKQTSGLKHGANFPEHVRSTGPRDHPGRQGMSGPSCPTLDPGPRFPEAEGGGTEKTFGLSFGYQNRINSTSDK